MTYPHGLFFLLLLIGMSTQTNAQMMDLPERYRAPVLEHAQLATITYNGQALLNTDEPDGVLRLGLGSTGVLSLSERTSGCSSDPHSPIGFKVAIKDHRTNTVWMYTEETLYAVDLDALLEKCQWGDKLIIMTVDRKYRLPRHEIDIMDGC